MKRIFLIITGLVIFILSALYTLGALNPKKEELTSQLPTPIPCAIMYDKPTDIEWTGEVVARFLSGVDYAVKKIPEDKEYAYFYAGHQDFDKAWEEKKEVGLEGLVKVKGKLVGMTDAYRNTIFGGCVPWVRIESIVEI